jgi:hypothetical protein
MSCSESPIYRCATNEPKATSGSPDFASKSQSEGLFVAQSSLERILIEIDALMALLAANRLMNREAVAARC